MVLVVIIVGTTGYMLIEHYDLLEALYVTVSVVTTLGLDASLSFSSGGKMFTIFVALCGATLFIFAAGFLADWFFSRVTKSRPNEKPEGVDFAAELDFFKGSRKDMRIAVAKIPDRMRKIDALKRFGVVVIGVEKGKFFDVNVPFAAKLKKGSNVVVMGAEKQISKFRI
ncbi:MAG: potassium channel family protein [Candidatus Woesearchaeota archaeon]